MNPEETNAPLIAEIRDMLEVSGISDYRIGLLLTELEANTSREWVVEWVVGELEKPRKSAASFVSKRITYATLTDPRAPSIGTTWGYHIARMVREGADEVSLIDDYCTMPLADFRARYKPSKSEKRECPTCGSIVDAARLKEES